MGSSAWTHEVGCNRQGRRTSWHYHRADAHCADSPAPTFQENLPTSLGCPSVTHLESHFLVSSGLKLEHHSVKLTLPFPWTFQRNSLIQS